MYSLNFVLRLVASSMLALGTSLFDDDVLGQANMLTPVHGWPRYMPYLDEA